MKKINGFENAVYYVCCVLTLGGFWLLRIVMTKALSGISDR